MKISPDHIIITNTNNQIAGKNVRQSHDARRTSASDETSVGSQATARFRAIDRSVRDVLDGLTLFQVADEAQSKIESTLGRMKKTAAQGTDETLTPDEREYLQFEMNDLGDLVGFISRNTRFENTLVFGDASVTTAMWGDVTARLDNAVLHGGNAGISAIANLGSRQLGIDGLDVRTAAGAREAEARLAAAAEKLAGSRALAGAQIARLGDAARTLAAGATNVFSSQVGLADADSMSGTFDTARRAILSSPASALAVQAAQAAQTQDDILNLTD